MRNSLGQSPCIVAAYLQVACNNGSGSLCSTPLSTLLTLWQADWLVIALPNATHYTGPDQTKINTCQCSTVTYSMISACGLCQNRDAERWVILQFLLNVVTTHSYCIMQLEHLEHQLYFGISTSVEFFWLEIALFLFNGLPDSHQLFLQTLLSQLGLIWMACLHLFNVSSSSHECLRIHSKVAGPGQSHCHASRYKCVLI